MQLCNNFTCKFVKIWAQICDIIIIFLFNTIIANINVVLKGVVLSFAGERFGCPLVTLESGHKVIVVELSILFGSKSVLRGALFVVVVY